MDRFRARYGDWVLIAGAAEGIGAAFTMLLGKKGLNIVMADNNLPAMQQLADKIHSEFKVDVSQVHIDLGKPEASEFLLQSTVNIDCRLLIYVAAFSRVKPFLSYKTEEIDRYIDVNSRTPIRLVHGFASRLTSQESSGGILLVSSLAGLLGPPLVAPYAATKGFQVRLAESLAAEFGPLRIDVTVCCAGLTNTPTYEMNTPAASRRWMKPMATGAVAAFALHNLGKKVVCIPGWKNRLNFFLLLRLLPRFISLKILGRTMKKMYH